MSKSDVELVGGLLHLGRFVCRKVGGDCVKEKLRDVLRDRLAVEGHGEGQLAVRVGHVV